MDPSRHRLLLLALLAGLVLLAAGCGSESGDDDAAGDAGATSTAAETGPSTEVTITFWPEGREGDSVEATLTCDPAGGTHPSPDKACMALLGDTAALDPVPQDAACTLIFGGPEQATVVGVVNGEEVDAAFERSNGCELDRWDRMAAVLQIGD